jgi:hypothetical protein
VSTVDDVSDGMEHRFHDKAPGPITGSLVLATWALFVGLGLMLMGAGLFGTLITVRSELDGFDALAIGLVSATETSELHAGDAPVVDGVDRQPGGQRTLVIGVGHTPERRDHRVPE